MPKLGSISPFFIVSSIKESVTFYVEKLGFELRFIGPEDSPFFAIVGRDAVSIMVKEITDVIKPIPNHTRHEWARWDAYIYTDEPGALFEEYQSCGLTFHRQLQEDEDGLLGFELKDADGYVLFFGRPKEQQLQAGYDKSLNIDNSYLRLHQIDIPGGFSGTVDVTEGSLKLELPTLAGTFPIKRYNLHLLTPERENIEFDLLRFQNGEWCDYPFLLNSFFSTTNSELKMAAKLEINKMEI